MSASIRSAFVPHDLKAPIAGAEDGPLAGLSVVIKDMFDIVGERKRTAFKVDNSNNRAAESFEITLRNRKKEAVEVRVVEHLFRWVNWEIREHSDAFSKLDAQKVEFRVKLEPNEERKLTYSVHYSW